MKKILLLTTFSAMISQSLWGGVYQCQSAFMAGVQEVEAFTSPLSAIRTLVGVDPYDNKSARILVQGRCASNSSSKSILEINQLEFTTSADPKNCWCQIIYPYFSKFVYQGGFEATGMCVKDCSRACANKIININGFDVVDIPPSEIIYTVQ